MKTHSASVSTRTASFCFAELPILCLSFLFLLLLGHFRLGSVSGEDRSESDARSHRVPSRQSWLPRFPHQHSESSLQTLQLHGLRTENLQSNGQSLAQTWGRTESTSGGTNAEEGHDVAYYAGGGQESVSTHSDKTETVKSSQTSFRSHSILLLPAHFLSSPVFHPEQLLRCSCSERSHSVEASGSWLTPAATLSKCCSGSEPTAAMF
jgi:hypothetical protein